MRKQEGFRMENCMKPEKTADFCRELGILVKSGVPLARALAVIARDESRGRREKQLFEELLRRIRQGQLLSEAMESMGTVFPPMLIHTFGVAEASGNLGQAAYSMGEYYRREHRMRESLKAATVYPKLLAGMILAVVIFLTGAVLPQFEDLFAALDVLPLSTRILYGIVSGIRKNWKNILTAGMIAGMGSRILFSMEVVQYHRDRLRLRVPILGKLRRKIGTARFAQTLAVLYSAGIPMMQALQMAGRAVENSYLEKEIERASGRLRAGDSLSEAMDSVDGFTRKFAYCIRIGETSDHLSDMLTAVAEDLNYEAETAEKKIIALAEPTMIIGMAGIIGWIMAAVMLPIYASYSAIEMSVY